MSQAVLPCHVVAREGHEWHERACLQSAEVVREARAEREVAGARTAWAEAGPVCLSPVPSLSPLSPPSFTPASSFSFRNKSTLYRKNGLPQIILLSVEVEEDMHETRISTKRIDKFIRPRFENS